MWKTCWHFATRSAMDFYSWSALTSITGCCKYFILVFHRFTYFVVIPAHSISITVYCKLSTYSFCSPNTAKISLSVGFANTILKMIYEVIAITIRFIGGRNGWSLNGYLSSLSCRFSLYAINSYIRRANTYSLLSRNSVGQTIRRPLIFNRNIIIGICGLANKNGFAIYCVLLESIVSKSHIYRDKDKITYCAKCVSGPVTSRW